MGAAIFDVAVKGTNAKDAFARAIKDAQYEYGHGGYTGSIAEKETFVMIGKVASREEARALGTKLLDDDDERVTDKWGPAGCIEYPGGFYFFGWASS